MSEEKRKPHEAENGEPSPYLRRSRQVEVRRSAVRFRRIAILGTALSLLGGLLLALIAIGLHTYLTGSPRFAMRDTLWIGGAERVSREQVVRVFGADHGRSVFAIPLSRRREELHAIPWVHSAHLMRGWPNRLRVVIKERAPVAFARVATGPQATASRLWLIDAEGVLMPLPRGSSFSLPVLTGIAESHSQEDRRSRVARMQGVLADLDRENPHRSSDVSEVDLSDLDDAAITVTPGGAAVLVHLGNANFLERYRLFLQNIEAWREQGAVRSVDMRFEKQVVVRP